MTLGGGDFGWTWIREDHRETLAERLAASVAADLARALRTRESASIAVSGGSTPIGFLQQLARRSELDWTRVVVVPTDERCVPADHPDRNERMLRDVFVDVVGARCVSLWGDDAKGGEDGASDAELADRRTALAAAPGPFEIVVLGFGTDGHTASLFPGTAGLAAALDPEGPENLVFGGPGPEGHRRVSLTVRAVSEAGRRIVLGFGAEKEEVLRRAFAAGPVEDLPLRAVLGTGRGEIWWAP